MTKEVQLVPANCAGAPGAPGENPPLLQTPVPVIVVYRDGKPIRIDGCPFYADRACIAGKNAVAENAPACLFTPKSAPETVAAPIVTPVTPEPNGTGKTLAVADTSPLAILSTPDPLEDSLYAGYLRLQSDTYGSEVDVDALATEVSNREKLLQTIQLLLGPYKDALTVASKRPNYKSRLRTRNDEEFAPVTNRLASLLSKDGHVQKTIEKRLVNGLVEPLHFDYEFNKAKKLDKITINFHENGYDWGDLSRKHAGIMKIHFTQDEIAKIELILGHSNRTGDSTDALLQSHGKKDSTLDRFIQSIPPSPLPDSVKLTGRTDLTVSFKDLTLYINTPYSKGNDGGRYYEELQYSAQFNRFLKKEDTKGENGLSVQDFLHLSLDILQILPFAKT